MNTIYLSLGSNIGDRAKNIHQTLRALEQEFALIETSFLYETDPVGYVDQGAFLNAVIKMQTTKTPEEVLETNERIMAQMGRVRTIHQGPRIIDIDVLLYYDETEALVERKFDALVLPHPRMHERLFVVEPLCDIDEQLYCYVAGMTYAELLKNLGGRQLQKVTPVGGRLIRWATRPVVMGIMNVTPDSFSGDGVAIDAGMREQKISELLISGADIIDIGGMSTRPGHTLISIEEEVARVVPAIEAVRMKRRELLNGVGVNTNANSNSNAVISVDTFRAEVARTAIECGAELINSVWGGSYDPDLLRVVAHAQVPMVLTENQSETSYFSTNQRMDDLIRNAIIAGIYRWNILVDLGVGFVKHTTDNYSIIAKLPDLKQLGYPVVFGASRKKFLQKLLVEQGSVGSGADSLSSSGDTSKVARNQLLLPLNLLVHKIAIMLGADVVRVHDVKEVVGIIDPII